MLRQASVLLGLAVLLSLLFPLQALLRQGGVDPLAVHVPGVDLAVLCAAAALLPAWALARHGKLAHRIPRWNLWIALLAFCSLAFVLLHVQWSLDLAAQWLREQIPGHEALALHAADLAVRLGVLAGVAGVLVNLQAVPSEDDLRPTRRARRAK